MADNMNALWNGEFWEMVSNACTTARVAEHTEVYRLCEACRIDLEERNVIDSRRRDGDLFEDQYNHCHGI